MTHPIRVVNLYSKADLNALLGNSSGDWTDYLPPPSVERRVTSPKPICLTEDASKFHLDMSFNRDGPKRGHNDCLFDGIGPKTLRPLVESPRLIASDIPDDADGSDWRKHFRKWAFPLRTDAPRGLTWGPYHDTLEVSLKRSADDDTCLQEPKRRRIFSILRSPQPPLLIRLKINKALLASIEKDSMTFKDHKPLVNSSLQPQKRSRSRSFVLSDDHRNQPKRLCNSKVAHEPTHTEIGKSKKGGKGRNVFTAYQNLNASESTCSDPKELVNVMLSPSKKSAPTRSRIQLCVASQLKYGS